MAKKVLVVDDDQPIADSLKLLLEDEGYEVEICGDGSFLKKHKNNSRPDIILLDYWLPGENGEQITRRLKRNKDTSKIPVIIFSASYNIKDQVFKAGADDFIEKPYEMEFMLKTLERHLV